MDFIDKLSQLSTRIKRSKDTVITEEATKTAFVLPFIQTLGYDIFNPEEVVPEFIADHSIKKGEKVDYALKREGNIVILIECKPIGAKLETKHSGQLYRYFSVTDARFGVLTDGIKYLFYSDLEKANRMDQRSFFEFNLLDYTDEQVEELKKFTKSSFDLETIIGTASNLKHHKAVMAELNNEYQNPSEDFVRLLTSKVYDGRFTQQVKEQFEDIVSKALKDFVRSKVKDRLKSALDDESMAESSGNESQSNEPIKVNDIETTKQEVEGFHIIQAITSEIVDPSRIIMRDAKSYCAILLDDNNRKPIIRFFFGKSKLSVIIFTVNGERKYELDKVTGLYSHKIEILEALNLY